MVSTYRYIPVGLLIFHDILSLLVVGSIAALIQSVMYGGQTDGWLSALQVEIGVTAAISPSFVTGVGSTMAVVDAGLQVAI